MNVELIEKILKGKRVYISVLNWGLGHATRMVPIIQLAKKHANYVLVGSNGQALEWLKNYFPDLLFIETPSFKVHYGATKLSTYFKLFYQAIVGIKKIRKEESFTQKVVCEHTINLIISDNVPGAFSNKVYSVYITHQLTLQGPFLIKTILTFFHKKYYSRFNEIWIPDFKEDYLSLSGKLSAVGSKTLPVYYIGALSRFYNYLNKSVGKSVSEQYNLAILSGPEPQQTLFANYLLNKALNDTVKWIFISPRTLRIACSDKIEVIVNPADEHFALLVVNANQIYCRSGYSTIMDLFYLNKKAVFIPTPGQWEQEYLATFHNNRKWLQNATALSS